nr:uncharacterized protein LOC113705983 [Coffea arabica]
MKLVDDHCDTVTGQDIFQRLYMCFAGVKQGFLAACRHVFGLDGTFLKGLAGGVLLTAVGVDANNGMYPIAYAATEGETKDSWIWFLTLLKEDLKIEKDYEWIIMSDKQKGIIQACETVFSNATHRFCVKHMHSNMSSAGFKEAAMRKAPWKAAKATTPIQFRRRIEAVAELDAEVAKWLDDKDLAEWSRSHFNTYPKCDMLLNNICESFKSKILDAREESIVAMMDEKHAVNIEEKTCSCRKWDLTGIPCYHAISALWIAMKDPMEHIDDCYRVEGIGSTAKKTTRRAVKKAGKGTKRVTKKIHMWHISANQLLPLLLNHLELGTFKFISDSPGPVNVVTKLLQLRFYGFYGFMAEMEFN